MKKFVNEIWTVVQKTKKNMHNASVKDTKSGL